MPLPGKPANFLQSPFLPTPLPCPSVRVRAPAAMSPVKPAPLTYPHVFSIVHGNRPPPPVQEAPVDRISVKEASGKESPVKIPFLKHNFLPRHTSAFPPRPWNYGLSLSIMAHSTTLLTHPGAVRIRHPTGSQTVPPVCLPTFSDVHACLEWCVFHLCACLIHVYLSP